MNINTTMRPSMYRTVEPRTPQQIQDMYNKLYNQIVNDPYLNIPQKSYLINMVRSILSRMPVASAENSNTTAPALNLTQRQLLTIDQVINNGRMTAGGSSLRAERVLDTDRSGTLTAGDVAIGSSHRFTGGRAYGSVTLSPEQVRRITSY